MLGSGVLPPLSILFYHSFAQLCRLQLFNLQSWLKYNQLLMLGRPGRAITLSQW